MMKILRFKIKYLLISLCALFLFACESQKVSTYLELDNGCFGLGFSEETEIVPNEKFPYSEPGFIHNLSLTHTIIMGNGTRFIWDGMPGRWTRFAATDGIEYQTFLMRFCPKMKSYETNIIYHSSINYPVRLCNHPLLDN